MQADAPVQSAFDRLYADLWLSIVDHIPPSAVWALCQVSRKFYELGYPYLYRTVDLSVHNWSPRRNIHTKSVRRWPEDAHAVLVRQYLFIEQLLRKPELADLVRRFTWSTGIEQFRPLPRERNGRIVFPPYDETNEDLKEVAWRPERVYTMFAMLNKVVEIDIDTGPVHHDSLAVMQLSPGTSLFPNARHIRLGGKMHFALASAILHGDDKAPLHCLSLNNVQEGGILHSGENLHMHINQGFGRRQIMNIITFQEDWPENSWPNQVGPGNMRRLLNASLISRCRDIQVLSLMKQGQQAWNQKVPGPETHDEEVYREWAAFIEAVKPHELTLTHGCYTEPPEYDGAYRQIFGTVRWWYADKSQGQIAPMDQLFKDIIVPVLKEGWPSLRKLATRGVSSLVLEDLLNLPAQVDINERRRFCWNGVVGGPLGPWK